MDYCYWRWHYPWHWDPLAGAYHMVVHLAQAEDAQDKKSGSSRSCVSRTQSAEPLPRRCPVAVSELRRDIDELRDSDYVLPQTLHAMFELLDREEKSLL